MLNSLFPENRAVYDVIRKNLAQPGKLQMTK